MFRGAPCNGGGCCAPAIPASYGSDCATCDNSAGYSEYQGDISGSDSYSGGSNYYNSGVISDDYPIEGTIIRPPMAPLTQPAS